jgi:hypothetical protein
MQLGMGGAVMNIGGGASSMGGSAQTGMGGSAPGGNAGSGSMPAGGCPDDVTELFRRPAAQGGCDGGSCHAGAIAPDLISPNVLDRLLNRPSTCQGRPYIGADDSFLAEKISVDRPACGGPMPFLTPQTLSAADEQCILDWIEEVASGN